MKVTSARAVDRLVVEEPCIGAAFTSFTFDPMFFEETILRAVLRLPSDPVEQRLRFLDEARAALVETPVAVIVDAGAREAGRRMPYDLLEVAGRTFHPKVALLLFEGHARLHVGSGNLTRGGYSENTELFVTLDLHYDEPADVAMLQQVDSFLAASASLARASGTQLGLFREELARRIGATEASSEATPFVVLHTERDTPILEQLLALVPEEATITRVGVLAPFFERDDRSTGSDVRSVLGRLAAAAKGKDFVFDVGVEWDEPSALSCPDIRTAKFEDAVGAVWARRIHMDTDEERMEYFTLDALTERQLQVRDASGVSRRLPREELTAVLKEGNAWPTPRPRVFAPSSLIESVAGVADLRVWLHPTWRSDDGRRLHRPLHAKLLLVTFTKRGKSQTLVLIGSPNASRRALLLTPDEGANIELALAMLMDGEVTLSDMAPVVVACDAGWIDWAERTFPDLPKNLGLCIESAVFDPKEKALTITWATPPPHALGDWSLLYAGTPLANGAGALPTPTVVAPFTLSTSACEVELLSAGASFFVPIFVTDLVALPTRASAEPLGLAELLMLLSRRITPERLATVRTRSSESGDAGLLDDLFGDGFSPTDVFKAWASSARDLSDPGRSFASFRRLLEGPMGLASAWSALFDAAQVETEVRREEAWFYGAELLRTLDRLVLPDAIDVKEKTERLALFVRRLRGELTTLAPTGAPWMASVETFYGVVG
jgi:hypothetical protein